MWYKYKNLSNSSSVVCYQINTDSIEIMYSDNSYYIYPVLKIGAANFEEMKRYAIRGQYLNRFIHHHVPYGYSYKDKRQFPSHIY